MELRGSIKAGDFVEKLNKEIKIKNTLNSEDKRNFYNLKFIIGKCVEDLEIDLNVEKKSKARKEVQKYEEDIKSFENKLFVLTYIFDNSFRGLINFNPSFLFKKK